jgi:hypothetical protein
MRIPSSPSIGIAKPHEGTGEDITIKTLVRYHEG